MRKYATSESLEITKPTEEELRIARKSYRRGNGDALSNRAAEPGSPEYDYLHRYDSPDNQRDSMG